MIHVTAQPQRIAAWLTSPAAPAVEQRLETHLSIVMLADRVYKIRKPVRFPFIDQSTPILRQAAALREMVRGQEFSPTLYSGIYFLTATGELATAGGPDDEPVLVMRRAPSHVCAAQVLPTADGETIDALARALADLQRTLPVVPPEEALENIRHAWEINYATLLEGDAPIPGAELRALQRATAKRYAALAPLIRQRAASGYARAGHGDLRLEHVFLTQPIVLIDPLDFDPRLYRTDVLAELAFLVMELRVDGHATVAERLATTYLARSGQDDVLPLLNFFVAYRALVRAKVTWLRGRQLVDAERAVAQVRARQYLALVCRSLEVSS